MEAKQALISQAAAFDAALEAPDHFDTPEEEAAYYEALTAFLDSTQAELSARFNHLYSVIRREEKDTAIHDAQIEWLKEELARMQSAKKRHKNHADRLKRYMVNCLRALENAGQSVTADAWVFKLAKNPPSLVCADESKTPPQYLITPDPVPDKKAIKEDIKGGAEVDGWELQQGYRLNVKAR